VSETREPISTSYPATAVSASEFCAVNVKSATLINPLDRIVSRSGRRTERRICLSSGARMRVCRGSIVEATLLPALPPPLLLLALHFIARGNGLFSSSFLSPCFFSIAFVGPRFPIGDSREKSSRRSRRNFRPGFSRRFSSTRHSNSATARASAIGAYLCVASAPFGVVVVQPDESRKTTEKAEGKRERLERLSTMTCHFRVTLARGNWARLKVKALCLCNFPDAEERVFYRRYRVSKELYAFAVLPVIESSNNR